jgi:nicotinamidase-related amidase
VEPPSPLALTDPPLPIDDKSGGCDTHDAFFKAWKRETAKLHIDPRDVVSDKGPEIYSLLKLRKIDNLLFMGVHTNMCVLNRPFAIKAMTKWGIRCVLIRDLTDAMYDPQAKPFVDHARGTELVIQHIEKYWCPTALSKDIR